MLYFSSIQNKEPHNKGAIFHQNVFKNYYRGASTAAFESAWAKFIKDNNLSVDTGAVRSKWNIPSSLRHLKNNRSIINFRTSTIVQLDEQIFLGMVRYEKKAPLSYGNTRQGASRRQVTVLYLPASTQISLLISHPNNFAAQYVLSSLNKLSKNGYDVYCSEQSKTFAQDLCDSLHSLQAKYDIEINAQGIWLLMGGDKRDAQSLLKAYECIKKIQLPSVQMSGHLTGDSYTKVHKAIQKKCFTYKCCFDRDIYFGGSNFVS